MKNNYIRVGYRQDLEIFVFDDHDPVECDRVRADVAQALRHSRGSAPVAMWRYCTGFSYPVIGEPSRLLPRDLEFVN